MADKKPTSRYFSNLGGINLKSSEYTLDKTQWLDLRNVDFDVPNALQKRPGSTQAVAIGTSGPVLSLFEYQRLNGASWVIAGSDTALFYLASNAYTLLDSGWNNGQPQDMLTFVNKLWIADGARFKSWDGGVSFGVVQVGLPCPRTVLRPVLSSDNGASLWTVAGMTAANPVGSGSEVSPALFVAYSYVRTDGFWGPIDLQLSARNIVQWTPATTGSELFSGTDFGADAQRIGGFTVPSGNGITAVALWVAGDVVSAAGASYGLAQKSSGSAFPVCDATMAPNANLDRFRLFTLVPAANLFTLTIGLSDVWGTTFIPSINVYSGGTGIGSTIMPFCYFDTNTPKYIDVNQNVMFMSGFSNAPSNIWFSEIGQPERVEPENFFEVRTNDGDRVIGHRTFNGTTIVLKETSFHKVIGTTPADFDLIELSLEFGAVSNQAVVEYNERLLWLDRKGIVQYDGAGWRIISDSIDEVFRRMNLSAAQEKACAVHHHYRNQIWFGIPVDGSTQNNLTVVYDYLVDAWTFFDGFNASSFGFITGPLSKDTVWRGNYSGMIYLHSESFYGDNGAGISCVPFSRFEQFEGENSTNVWRRLFLDVGTVSGLTGVINGQVFSDYNRSTIRATFTMYQNVFQSKAEMGVVGKAVAVQFSHFSASLPFLINGYSWTKRNLRNV